MKYIFTVHSHIAFLSALSVIGYYKFNKKDVLIIASNYAVPLNDFYVYDSYDMLEKNLFIK